MNMLYKKYILLLVAGYFSSHALLAQEQPRTIEITSTFKPSLLPGQKINFAPSPFSSDSSRRVQAYRLPGQNLQIRFFPAPVSPLAYQGELTDTAKDQFYVKAGYGNFRTPYLKAKASLGANEYFNGNIRLDYRSSKGNMVRQQFSNLDAGITTVQHLDESRSLQLYGGYQLQSTYRYGGFGKDSVAQANAEKLIYNDIMLGTSLRNAQELGYGIKMEGNLEMHFFTDNHKGREISLAYDVPFSRKFSDDFSASVSAKGLVSFLNKSSIDYTNNLFSFPARVSFDALENLKIHAGLTPALANGKFRVLPDVMAEFGMPENNLVIEAGVAGYYTQQTYWRLANMNHWIYAPDSLKHTRNVELFGAVKTSLAENVQLRIKAGYGKVYDLPTFYATGQYLDSFRIGNAAEVSRLNLTAELDYHLAETIIWNTSLTVNRYGDVLVTSKPYGYLPFELRSSLEWKPVSRLSVTADLYRFGGAWFNEKNGDNHRGDGGFDLNAGASYQIVPQAGIWLQTHNLLNMDYTRWRGYPALGLQILAGVSISL